MIVVLSLIDTIPKMENRSTFSVAFNSLLKISFGVKKLGNQIDMQNYLESWKLA